MRQKTLRALAICGTALLTVMGCMMRYYQLQTIFDETGLPVSGSPATWLLTFLSVLLALECVLLSWPLPRCRREKRIFVPNAAALAMGLLSGACLLLGGALSLAAQLRGAAAGYELALALAQLAAGICVLAASWRRWRGASGLPLVHAVICLWMVLVLLLHFKNWSMDPTILDYCFRLFALICGMCATYHIGTFGFDRGGRRVTVFWCLAGCYFLPVSAIGEALTWKLMAAGVCLWLLGNAWQLLDEPGPAEQPGQAADSDEAAQN